MPINKNRNVNLQLTITKDTSDRLNYIVDDLSHRLNICLTKSQAITILINDYKTIVKEQPKKEQPKTKKTGLNYQSQILALKDKINVSFPHLSEIINIPLSTLKRYAYGQQTPNGENEQKLINALKRYGIK